MANGLQPSEYVGKTWVCVRTCYTYNKRFKTGDKFPAEWLASGYFPNHHFMEASEANEYLRTSSNKRPVMCSGDDPRSNVELKRILEGSGIGVADTWGRKELWNEVQKLELKQAKGNPAAEPQRGGRK